MNKLFSTLFSALRARFTALWTKLRLWASPTYWRTRGFTLLRQWFSKLFDVRPRDRKDYYGVARWLVSKRLAFAVVVVLGVVGALYIYAVLPARGAGAAGGDVRTYRYSALSLKFYSGSVRILAADGDLAYAGEVDKAQCTGRGTLYDKNGATVYEGDFADSMYNGAGVLYYPDGTPRYKGTFTDNLYNGRGSCFRPTGTVEYFGDYVSGVRSGQGELYNSAGGKIFTGSFQRDNIVYSELLGKSTAEVAQMYTGTSEIYTAGGEYAVAMPEIGAVYAAGGGDTSLDGRWTVSGVYVLSNTLEAEGQSFSTVNQVTAAFGQPDYMGAAWVTLPEAVASNLLARTDRKQLPKVDMGLAADFGGVYTVSGYDKNAQVNIYTYVREGLTYTLYGAGSGSDSFVMYAVELA